MKAIDSKLLVYASLADHPAATACEQFITQCGVWFTNVDNLVELRRVLVAVYGDSDSDADARVADFRDALIVEDLTVAAAPETARC